MKFIIGAGIVLCALQANAQDPVESWQSEHPEILFFEASKFHSLSEEQQAQLASRVILYTEQITLSVIEQFEANSTALVKADIPIDDQHGDEIKRWLAEHPHTKIITQEYYNSVNSTRQHIYVQNGTLILAGNTITLNDLTNYEVSY